MVTKMAGGQLSHPYWAFPIRSSVVKCVKRTHTQSQACTVTPINSDRFSGKFMEKPSSIISQCLKVHVPTQRFKGLRDPFIPIYTLSWLTCHPLSYSCPLLKPTTSLRIKDLYLFPQEAVEEEGGCFPLCTEPDTGWPFVPRLCCLHCFLALTMQVLLQNRPKSKAED